MTCRQMRAASRDPLQLVQKLPFVGAALCSTEAYFTDVASVASYDIAEYALQDCPRQGAHGVHGGDGHGRLGIEFSYLPDEAVTTTLRSC